MAHDSLNASGLTRRELMTRVFDMPGFLRLVLTDAGGEGIRRSLRPATVRDERRFLFETQADGRATAVTLADREARRTLAEWLRGGFRDAHLHTTTLDLHARRTRKGRILVARGRPSNPEAREAPPHDRKKTHLLDAMDSRRLLQALGLADADGAIFPSKQSKYRQINAFLETVRDMTAHRPSGPLHILDAGCGKASLTFAACHYLEHALEISVVMTGIDRNPALIRDCRERADRLGMSDRMRFEACDLADFRSDAPPEMLLALHACDTASDLALARGVQWGCRSILCAPCCQHALHQTLGRGGAPQGPPRALIRHGLLRQRFGDVLTDAFRAQLLRVGGYRVTVREFVDPDATARNLLLSAERGIKPGAREAVAEYLALRDFAGVAPPLEAMLGDLADAWLRG